MKKYILILTVFILSLQSPISFAEEDETFSEAQLEQILAPIALYPDSVLTHILIASTYPLEVIEANRWLSKNSHLETTTAIEKADEKSWDPSVKALIPFPKILQRMSDELDWTQSIGDAFLDNEERVLSSIQSLRLKADQAGTFNDMKHMKVTREESNIVIQPIEREVIYVPYYDTRVVYGNWHWHHNPPVYWDWHASHHRHHYHGFNWYPSVHIGIGHHFYFSAFHWHNRHVVVVNRHRHHRRHYQRAQIIRHENAHRWTHNPTHRRGVAYRNDKIRKKYHSNRPSVAQTRQIRRNENSRRADVRKTNVQRNHATRNRIDSAHSSKELQTRQQRLNQRLTSQRVRTAQEKPREARQTTRANRTTSQTQSRTTALQNREITQKKERLQKRTTQNRRDEVKRERARTENTERVKKPTVQRNEIKREQNNRSTNRQKTERNRNDKKAERRTKASNDRRSNRADNSRSRSSSRGDHR